MFAALCRQITSHPELWADAFVGAATLFFLGWLLFGTPVAGA